MEDVKLYPMWIVPTIFHTTERTQLPVINQRDRFNLQHVLFMVHVTNPYSWKCTHINPAPKKTTSSLEPCDSKIFPPLRSVVGIPRKLLINKKLPRNNEDKEKGNSLS